MITVLVECAQPVTALLWARNHSALVQPGDQGIFEEILTQDAAESGLVRTDGAASEALSTGTQLHPFLETPAAVEMLALAERNDGVDRDLVADLTLKATRHARSSNRPWDKDGRRRQANAGLAAVGQITTSEQLGKATDKLLLERLPLNISGCHDMRYNLVNTLIRL